MLRDLHAAGVPAVRAHQLVRRAVPAGAGALRLPGPLRRHRGVRGGGVAKPDPAIFEVLRDAGSAGRWRRCVFVDDSAANVAAAERAGLDAIRFTGDRRCGLSCGRAACRSEAAARARRGVGQRGPLDLQQRDALPLRLERRLAAADPEEPLGPEDVDHREDVERERRDPHPGDRLDDLVDLQRDEDAECRPPRRTRPSASSSRARPPRRARGRRTRAPRPRPSPASSAGR